MINNEKISHKYGHKGRYPINEPINPATRRDQIHHEDQVRQYAVPLYPQEQTQSHQQGVLQHQEHQHPEQNQIAQEE